MTASLPQLRSDLLVRGQRTAGGEIAVVKDPASGEFYRFGAIERFVLERLDGRTSAEQIRRRAQAQFGAPLPPDTLALFIRRLDQAGLLEREGSRPHRKRVRFWRFRGNLLYLRLPLFDPTRVFDWLLPRVRFLFTRGFVVCSALVIVFAIALLAGNWQAFTQDVPRLYQLSSIPMFMVIVCVLVMAHEFGHGLTCRHFGGEVHEIGFLLLYFQPAWYCNVSDAWLFPDRAKRLWVGFAGPYFELFLWALAVMVWRVTAVDTWINYVALVALTGCGVKTLFNFNPLIKFDGYYLLSDWLDIPNLRKKAFRYVGDGLKRLSGWGTTMVHRVGARERRVYLVYGVLATVYSFSLLGWVTFELGGFLIAEGQTLALALLAGVVSARFRHRVRGLLGKSSEEDDPEDAGDTATGPPAQRPPRSRRSRRDRSRWPRRLTIIGVAAAGVAALFLVQVELRVSGPVTVLPEENADVRASVEGIVEAIFVDEGDHVEAGQPIARLSAGSLLSDLHETEAAIRTTSANLRKLEVGPRAEEIAVARAAVARTRDAAGHANNRWERVRELYANGGVTRAERDDAEAAATAAEHDLAEATRRLDVLLIGTRPEDIDAAHGQLQELESRRAYLEDQVSRLDIVSPEDGVVATPSRQLHLMARKLVPRGGLIAKVYDFRTMVAQIAIPEKEIGVVRVGQRVELRARAYPNRTFHGTVTAVAIAAEGGPLSDQGASEPTAKPSGAGTFIVSTQIENDSLLLRPGMTGQAKVFCGPRSVADVIGRRLARTLKVEVWSWW